MITDNCLVGCKHDQHHRHCDLFVYNDLKSIPFTVDADFSKRVMFKRIEEIIYQFDLKFKSQTNFNQKAKQYYFVWHCLNKFRFFQSNVMIFLDFSLNNYNYAKKKHLELKGQQHYQDSIKDIEIELNKIRL